MNDPVKVSDKPLAEEVEAGKSYYICNCGESKKQPFCDGSHKGSKYSPTKFAAKESKKVYFCGCKKSSSLPLCDGNHKNISA